MDFDQQSDSWDSADMEQGGISIISPGITENSVSKSKSIGITLRSNSIQTAKKKLNSPWLQNLLREEATIWDTFLLILAEIIGTAILLFIGCMGCVGSMGFKPPLLQLSLAFGFAVMIAIQCVGHISGAHINPSITLASLILGKISLPMSIIYMISQCAGGLVGYGLLKVITPEHLLHGGDPDTAGSFCMTDIHRDMATAQGLFAEILATAILVFFACGVWDLRNEKNTDSTPLRFGFCVGVLCFTFVPYTGCSLNPARTLAVAVWNGYWTNHWVFWIGPLGGAVLASVLYRCLFLPKQDPEEAPLNGIET